MSDKERPKKKGKPTADLMHFGYKPAAMTPVDKETKRAATMQTNDAMKPAAMTPVPGTSEDRGLKPAPMTPAQAPRPAQPANAPAKPKK